MQAITRTISADKLAEVMELPKSLLGQQVLVTINARAGAASAAEKADEKADSESEVPNEETLKAIEEVRAMIASGEKGEMDIDKFFAEIETDA